MTFSTLFELIFLFPDKPTNVCMNYLVEMICHVLSLQYVSFFMHVICSQMHGILITVLITLGGNVSGAVMSAWGRIY